MGKLWAYAQGAEKTENPVNIYLDNIKGNLWVWNKETKENEFHDLNKFIILSIWFTIKGKVWDDSIKQYTNTYFSNEIRQFNETIYAIDMVFINNKAVKSLAAKGKWKTDVKPHMPQAVWIKAMITVLDLNDAKIKSFPVAASQYFGKTWLQASIESFEPTDVLKYDMVKMYTDWSKDKSGQDILITEAELDEMKWSAAAKFKNRYISRIAKVTEWTAEEIEAAESYVDAVDDYYKSKRKYYEDTYWNGEVVEELNYAPEPTGIQSDEDFAKEVKAEQKADIKQDVSIEEVPW